MPFASRPSMVTTERPATSLSAVAQARAASPSTWTVQEPHWAMPQPYFVPVSPSSSRRYQSSGIDPSPSKACSWPLTRNLTIAHLPRKECERFGRRRARRGRLAAGRGGGGAAGPPGPRGGGRGGGGTAGGATGRCKEWQSRQWHAGAVGGAGAAAAGARRVDGARAGARQRRAQGQREPKPERLERGRPGLGQRQMTGAWLLAPFAGSQGRIERLIDMSQPTIADRESPLTRSKWICRLDLLRSGPPALRHRGPPPLAWFWQAV